MTPVAPESEAGKVDPARMMASRTRWAESSEIWIRMGEEEPCTGHWIAHVVAPGSWQSVSLILLALAGYERREARLTSKLPGVSIRAGSH
jgi:hypothetical protein